MALSTWYFKKMNLKIISVQLPAKLPKLASNKVAPISGFDEFCLKAPLNQGSQLKGIKNPLAFESGFLDKAFLLKAYIDQNPIVKSSTKIDTLFTGLERQKKYRYVEEESQQREVQLSSCEEFVNTFPYSLDEKTCSVCAPCFPFWNMGIALQNTTQSSYSWPIAAIPMALGVSLAPVERITELLCCFICLGETRCIPNWAFEPKPLYKEGVETIITQQPKTGYETVPNQETVAKFKELFLTIDSLISTAVKNAKEAQELEALRQKRRDAFILKHKKFFEDHCLTEAKIAQIIADVRFPEEAEWIIKKIEGERVRILADYENKFRLRHFRFFDSATLSDLTDSEITLALSDSRSEMHKKTITEPIFSARVSEQTFIYYQDKPEYYIDLASFVTDKINQAIDNYKTQTHTVWGEIEVPVHPDSDLKRKERVIVTEIRPEAAKQIDRLTKILDGRS